MNSSDISEFCPHCMRYTVNGSDAYDNTFSCTMKRMAESLDDGISYSVVSSLEVESCEMKGVYKQGLYGVIPLIVISLIYIINVCCLDFCGKKNIQNGYVQ